MGSLDGKVAIVTGGGGGVGRGICLAFAKEGARVVVLDLDPAAASSVADAVSSAGGEAIPLTCDISKTDAVDQAVATVVEKFGTVDILVNNAQASRGGVAFEDITDDDLDLAFGTGPFAAVRFMRASFPHLKCGGRVINLRSASELVGLAGMGAYIGAKGAIGGLTRTAAREWGQHGITVNCLAPAVMSPAAQGYFDANPDELKALTANMSIPRFGDAESDVGRVAVFLAGPDAGYVTGCTVSADGGGAFYS
jgi:NAD(P)-dependent dehydrogenase (short-subunit alcohol dehydrogenase family)